MNEPIKINRRVLTVDDNPSIHDDYRRALCPIQKDSAVDALEASIFGGAAAPASPAGEPFEVEKALQGEEALERIRTALDRGQPFAVVFVDMRMPPGWDGVETIEHLWAADPSILVVICSAYSDYEWSDVLKRLPRRDQLLLLRKPFDPTEVWQMAESLCHKWTLSQKQLKSLEEANERLAQELRERERAEERLRHAALHDALTSLPNRALLLDRIAASIGRAQRRPNEATAILYLDLDNFKIVNDSLGHLAGDTILIEAARRLSDIVRTCDTIGRPQSSLAARLGGDEFVIMLEDVGDAVRAMQVGQRILESLNRPFAIQNREVTLGSSLGIAMTDRPDRSPEDLLRNADTAMYQAKFGGKGRCVLFDDRMHAAVLERMTLEADLRGAAARGELTVAYQPIVALESGSFAGFEALLRWSHPKRGSVPPDVFIPIAEESSLIDTISDWILDRAAQDLSAWRTAIPAAVDMYVSVNVSRRLLRDPVLPDRCRAIIASRGLKPSDFAFEITESAIMCAPDTAMEVLEGLRQDGAAIMMDDFGTGHSSLSCLHRFPIDVLKIDRAFVQTQQCSREYAAIVQSIVTLAHNLGHTVVAEGVETAEHLAQLQALECDLAQGYYFSKPMPASTIETMLRAGPAFRAAA